jgi:hypothetical protein
MVVIQYHGACSRRGRLMCVDIDAAADELYGLPPAEFTQARDTYVAQARSEGDRQAIDALKKLRRPSIGAWMANLLVRARAADVQRLISLGASLRDAQDRLDGETMRLLTKDGRAEVTALVRAATDIVRERGERVSVAASEELAATLDAALADAESAAALHAGRLTTGLRYSGLGLLGIDSPPSKAGGSRASGHAGSGRPRRSELAAVALQLEAAKHDLARAQERDREARSAVSSAEARLHGLKEKAAQATRVLRDAEKDARSVEKKLNALRGDGS